MNNSSSKKVYHSVMDHSVSGETFELRYNKEYEMLETYPQPSEETLPAYYQSENYISHTDAKRNLLEKTYQFIKSISLKRKLKLIDKVSPGGKRLLDIGCGTGDFIQIAQKNKWSVFGIEPNTKARMIANQKVNDSVFDVDHLKKFEPNSFDVITLWHVLEHLPNLEDQLKLFYNLLKPKGKLLIAVPNYKSYDANHYKEFWAAFDVPRHLWHFSQTSMSKLISNANMELNQILPMSFDAYYVSLLSEKYKSGYLNPVRAFFVGWQSNRKAKVSGEYSSLIYVVSKCHNQL